MATLSETAPRSATPLRFSVIVPAHARPGPLAACLDALARQDYAADRFEVIVVDDGSDPPLEPVATNGPRVRWLRQAHAGPAAARNSGAAAAAGEVLAFTDDDCRPAAGWLSALAAGLAGRTDTAVGGRTLNALRDDPYAAAGQLLMDHLHATFNRDPERARFFPSNNLALPASRFRSIGGFDRRFTRAAGEDRDLCERWLSSGWSLRYAPEAVVEHAHALTLKSFVRQQVDYGRGAATYRAIHGEAGRRRGGPQALSFYVELIARPLRRHGLAGGARPAALLVVAQAATAAGCLLQRLSRSEG
jgi:GT2 family glycosyltransferase